MGKKFYPKPKPVKVVKKVIVVHIDAEQENEVTIEKSIVLAKEIDIDQDNTIKVEIG